MTMTELKIILVDNLVGIPLHGVFLARLGAGCGD